MSLEINKDFSYESDKEDDPSLIEEEGNESALSEKGIGQINRREKGTGQLATETRYYLGKARGSLQKLAREKEILDNSDHLYLQKKITELEEKPDAEKAKQLWEEIEEYEERKLKLTSKEDLLRDIDDPELKPHIDKIDQIFANPETAKFIGAKQVEAFRNWCKNRINSHPTIKNAKETINLVQNHSIDGIKPRKEYYETQIKPFLSHYGININEAPFLRDEGFSERKKATPLMKQGAKIIEQGHEKGLYSYSRKQKIIAEMIKSPDINTIRNTATMIEKISRKESEQYIDQNSSIFKTTKVTVHGTQIRAMSDASVKAFLRDYKEYDLNLRETTILNWKKIIENEGKLIKELGTIYENDPEGFRKALNSFELLDYSQKQKALEDHKKSVEQNEKELLHESLEILSNTLKEIEKARSEKVISNKTAIRFQKTAQDKSGYTNPSTGRIDLKKQQELLDALTSKSPVHEKGKRNIAAYRQNRGTFVEDLKNLAKISPETTLEKFANRQKEYDEESYEKRKLLHKKLKEELQKKEKERTESKKTQEKLGVSDREIKEAQKNSPERMKLVEAVKAYIKENSPESIEKGLTAIHLYFAFSKEKISRDRELYNLMQKLIRMEELTGSPEEDTEADEDAEREKDIEEILRDNENHVGDDIKKHKKIKKASELIRQSEEQHDGKKDASERSKKAALERSSDEIEDKIIEEYHDQGGLLDRENKGEEFIKITANEHEMNEENWVKAKDRVDKENIDNLKDKAGSTGLEMIGSGGQTLDAESRKKELSRREDAIAQKIGEQLAERRREKSVLSPKSGFSGLTERIASKRAAEKTTKEKVKKAA